MIIIIVMMKMIPILPMFPTFTKSTNLSCNENIVIIIYISILNPVYVAGVFLSLSASGQSH